MPQKLHKIVINYVCIGIALLFLFLPLFLLSDDSTNKVMEDKILFGFNYINGYILKDNTKDAVSGNMIPILYSNAISLVPILLLLSIFILDKIPNKTFGKEIINVAVSAACLIIVFLLPVISPQFVNESYRDFLEFKIMWGFIIILVLLSLLVIYFIIHLVFAVKYYLKNRDTTN